MDRDLSAVFNDYNHGKKITHFSPWVYKSLPGDHHTIQVIPGKEFERIYQGHAAISRDNSPAPLDIWLIPSGGNSRKGDFFNPTCFPVNSMGGAELALMHPFFDGMWAEESMVFPWIESRALGLLEIDRSPGFNKFDVPMLRAYVQSLMCRTPFYHWCIPTHHMDIARISSPLHLSYANITFYHVLLEAVLEDRDLLQQELYDSREWLAQFKQSQAPEIIYVRDLTPRLNYEKKFTTYSLAKERAALQAAYPDEGFPFRVEYLMGPGQVVL